MVGRGFGAGAAEEEEGGGGSISPQVGVAGESGTGASGVEKEEGGESSLLLNDADAVPPGVLD